MTATVDERSRAFVVRIWAEGRKLLGGEPPWRGSVDDVRRGGCAYFSTLAELCEYLSTRPHKTGTEIVSVQRATRIPYPNCVDVY